MKATKRKHLVDGPPPLPRFDEVVRYNTTADGKAKAELAARIKGKPVAAFLRDLIEPQLDTIISEWNASRAA